MTCGPIRHSTGLARKAALAGEFSLVGRVPTISSFIKANTDGRTAEERDGIKYQLAEKLQELSILPDTTRLQRARLQPNIAESLNVLERRKLRAKWMPSWVANGGSTVTSCVADCPIDWI